MDYEIESKSFVIEAPRNFVAPAEINAELENLVEEGALNQEQFGKLILALEMSKYIYAGIFRNDGIRSHLTGHIYTGLKDIIDNRVEISEYLVDGEDEDKSDHLVELMLTYIGHDWYEDHPRPDDLEIFRQIVIDAFGEKIDQNIWAISKFPPKEGQTRAERDKEYEERLDRGGKIVVEAKFHDRKQNISDDFGSPDPYRNIRYITETEELLFPLFDKYNVPLLGNMRGMIKELKEDARKRIYFGNFLQEIIEDLENMKGSQNGRSDTAEHSRRVLELFTQYSNDFGLRDSLAMRGAILYHDYDKYLLDLPTSDNYDMLRKRIGPFADLWYYSVGIAIARSEYDSGIQEIRRDPSMYKHLGEDIAREIENINLGKLFMSRDDLAAKGLLENVIPRPIDFDTMLDMLEMDIEGLHILTLETIDNLANPPKNENGQVNAAYQWKAAQELLIMAPMLELAGFSVLAQFATGEAFEFLYEDSAVAEDVKQEYERYEGFLEDPVTGGRIREVLWESKSLGWQTVIQENLKTLGGAYEKEIRTRKEKGHIPPSDNYRFRLIFMDGEVNGMPGILTKMEDFIKELQVGIEFFLPDYKISIRHPLSITGSSTENFKVKVGPEVDLTELQSVAERIEEDLPVDVSIAIGEDNKSFQGVQFYLKLEKEGEKPFYIEFAVMNQTMHWINTTDAAHILYKMKKMGLSVDLGNSSEEQVHKIVDLYRRGAGFRISPQGRPYLTDKVINKMIELGIISGREEAGIIPLPDDAGDGNIVDDNLWMMHAHLVS